MARFRDYLRSKLWKSKKDNKTSRDRRSKLLQMETLEQRQLFAVDVAIGVGVRDHALIINGTEASDTVSVYWEKNDPTLNHDDQIVVRDQSGLVGRYNMWGWNTLSARWDHAFDGIEFHGGKGNDSFRINGETPLIESTYGHLNWFDPLSIVAFGDEGNDFLEGGNGYDWLYGGKGDDQLIGHASQGDHADHLFGEEGNDTLFGDEVPKAGSSSYPNYNAALRSVLGGYNDIDKMYGGDGHDLLIAGIASPTTSMPEAMDLLIGGAGNDTLDGHFAVMWGDFTADQLAKFPEWAAKSGNDVLIARDRAEMHGGAGDDKITGSDANNPHKSVPGDTIYGDDGNDTIDAKGGADLVYGGNGNDTIKGGDGVDRLYGENGLDTLEGGKGGDYLYGGELKDKIFGGDDDDFLYGGSGDDEMFGGLGIDFMSGEDGNDYIWGDQGNDILYGGVGNDQLYGADGHDTLRGGEGNDTLQGGTGNDKLFGDNGQDTLYGEDGDDELDGGADIYWDTLFGGKGKDKFKVDLTGIGIGVKNRDKPGDFNATEGDSYV